MAEASRLERQVKVAFQRLTDILADQPVRLSKVLDSQTAFEKYVLAQVAVFDSEYDGTTAPLKRNSVSGILWEQRLKIVEGLVRDIRPDEELA